MDDVGKNNLLKNRNNYKISTTKTHLVKIIFSELRQHEVCQQHEKCCTKKIK